MLLRTAAALFQLANGLTRRTPFQRTVVVVVLLVLLVLLVAGMALQ